MQKSPGVTYRRGRGEKWQHLPRGVDIFNVEVKRIKGAWVVAQYSQIERAQA
ncbi:MAG: hypothetical protein QM638_10765 [Nocardioides sp.]|uniref:hypothetical protein n=1 Tax=Nocardioides sp. TaxID=35761 RepID=UPI0039E58FB1